MRDFEDNKACREQFKGQDEAWLDVLVMHVPELFLSDVGYRIRTKYKKLLAGSIQRRGFVHADLCRKSVYVENLCPKHLRPGEEIVFAKCENICLQNAQAPFRGASHRGKKRTFADLTGAAAQVVSWASARAMQDAPPQLMGRITFWFLLLVAVECLSSSSNEEKLLDGPASKQNFGLNDPF